MLFKKNADEMDVLKLALDWTPKINHIGVFVALAITAPHFGSVENWVRFDKDRLREFLDWLKEKKLETRAFSIAEIATNEYLI